MADDIDKIVRTLQEAILEGYSEKFKTGISQSQKYWENRRCRQPD